MPEAKNYSGLSREELYELAWTTPMIRLAKDFGLSDQGLRKVCITKQIPLPKAGYWAKVAVGRIPSRPPLPEFSEVKRKARHTRALRERKAVQVAESANWQPPSAGDEGPISWHRAISEFRKDVAELAKKAERHKAVSQWEAERPGKEHPDRKRFDIYGDWKYRVDRGELVLDTHKRHPFRVSLSHWQRGLLVLNAILNRASADGYQVAMSKEGDRIEIARGEFTVTLRITEKMEPGYRKEYRSWNKTFENVKVLTPTGRLSVLVEPGAGGETAVTDSVGAYLEKRLDEVMTLISKKVTATEKWTNERNEWHRQYEEEQRRQQEAERAREAERQRLAKEAALDAAIVKEAESWGKANSVRQYLEELDSRLAKGGITTDGYSEWRTRAEAVIRDLDPCDRRVQHNGPSE
jgi:hypothetical protein